jgi:hypothetical protein
MYKITWKKAKTLRDFDLIEHPLNSFLVPKEEFEEEFSLLLSEFDGTTSSDYFDFYFSRCPINCNSFKFRDDDCKEDFINACVDLGILPELAEVLQGESKSEKDLRKAKSSEDLVNDFKMLKSKEMSKKFNSDGYSEEEEDHSVKKSNKKIKEKMYKSKAQQVQDSFHKLMKELDECTDDIKKKHIEEKLSRVMALMEHTL